MEPSADKTTLTMWVSTRDQSELTSDQALTGVVNLFMEVCAMIGVDPHSAVDAFFKTARENRAADASGDFN